MGHDLDRVIERVVGLDDATRNALVHLAAQKLAAEGVLVLMRSHMEPNGATFDLFRDRRTGKTYITRKPDLGDEEEVLRARLAKMLDDVPAEVEDRSRY